MLIHGGVGKKALMPCTVNEWVLFFCRDFMTCAKVRCGKALGFCVTG